MLSVPSRTALIECLAAKPLQHVRSALLTRCAQLRALGAWFLTAEDAASAKDRDALSATNLETMAAVHSSAILCALCSYSRACLGSVFHALSVRSCS